MPYSCRDRPTANSQMSIISCTSPRASEVILPASMVTSAAEVGLVRGQQLAEPGHQGAAHRGRGGAPGRERLRRFGNGGLGVGRTGLVHLNNTSPVIGVLAGRPVPGGCPQVHCGAHRAQGSAHPVA